MPRPQSSLATVRHAPVTAVLVALAVLGAACTPADESDVSEGQSAEDPGEDPEDAGQDDAAGLPDTGQGVDIVALVQDFAPQTVAVEVAIEQQGQSAQGAGSGVI